MTEKRNAKTYILSVFDDFGVGIGQELMLGTIISQGNPEKYEAQVLNQALMELSGEKYIELTESFTIRRLK